MATAAGIEEGSTGGKLWRIGGATDLWDVLGADAARAHIKERGRWKTDIPPRAPGRAAQRRGRHG